MDAEDQCFVYIPKDVKLPKETGDPLMWIDGDKLIIWRGESYIPIILNDSWVKAFPVFVEEKK